jgi:hypothetical protein
VYRSKPFIVARVLCCLFVDLIWRNVLYITVERETLLRVSLALAGTQWAQAQVHTIRLRLLKIAAEVRLSVRRIWVSFSNAYPWKDMFAAAWLALRC